MSIIADIGKDVPIHLELASMTDKDYMNRIIREVRVVHKEAKFPRCNLSLLVLCSASASECFDKSTDFLLVIFVQIIYFNTNI